MALEFVGIPVPGESLLSFLGYMTRKSSDISMILPIVYSIIGTNIGSIIAYAIGFRFGRSVLVKYGKYVFITPDKLETTDKMFSKNKVFILLFNRYILGIRHIVPYLSGISRVKVRSFLLYNLLGSILWCTSFILLGHVVGENVKSIGKVVKQYSYVLALAVVAISILVIIYNSWKRRHRGKIND